MVAPPLTRHHTPLPVRGAAVAFACAAVVALAHGGLQVMGAMAEEESADSLGAAIGAGLMFFVAVGHAAAAVGLAIGRWGARQLGILTTIATVPTGLFLGLISAYATDESPLAVAQLVTVVGAMTVAVLGMGLASHRVVRPYLVGAVPAVSPGRAKRLLVRAQVLLVTVALALFTTAVNLIAAIGLMVQDHVNPATEDPGETVARFVIRVLVVLLFGVSAVLCLVGAGRVRSRPWARRVALGGLWTYAFYAVPATLVSAIWLTVDPGAGDIRLIARFTFGAALLAQLVACAGTVAAVVLLHHPGVRAYAGPDGSRHVDR